MDLNKLRTQIESEIVALKTDADCVTFHQKFLGKNGMITDLMSTLRNLEPEMRGKVGAEINTLKRDTESRLFTLQREIKDRELNEKLMQDKLVDITIPNINHEVGSFHPITRISREVEEVFQSMGFHIENGREIVTEYENFESLNVPANHPARDMQDTFWLSNGDVLKTHTSALQNILLKKHGPVFGAIFPGRCYRNENLDATHEMAFFQVEGMMVSENISISNLIYFMKTALTAVFKKDIKVRLRPGFFPFTEPSFELDASCIFCNQVGCSICKQSGWIEFCGCGMIHPRVLEMGGVDPNKYQGFAFGFGLTRLAMMKYGIEDIRVLNSGNLDSLRAIK
ncbi:MAG: phenylalanine--tRNA ligase subunit alpha [Firmicutes bacterium]|nr:phenylalanine--tRNA ligase subunit alpha [Bacillota bacterium]